MVAGTAYNDLIAQDLGRMALRGLVAKTAMDTSKLDYVIMGNVIQEVRTSNIARESALGAGFPDTVPVSGVCIISEERWTSVA